MRCSTLLYLVAIACWFVALFTGSVPSGLQSVGLFCPALQQLRTYAYLYLVNPRYPSFSGDSGSASLPADQTALPPIP